jgi:hypothetical protein
MFCGCLCHDRGLTMKEQLQHLGFELGAQWYSFDCGLTWERFPGPAAKMPTAGTMTVVGIDRDRGEITVRVNPRRP